MLHDDGFQFRFAQNNKKSCTKTHLEGRSTRVGNVEASASRKIFNFLSSFIISKHNNG